MSASFVICSLSPSCSSSLCHSCMVTQRLQRCCIWMAPWMSHALIGHWNKAISLKQVHKKHLRRVLSEPRSAQVWCIRSVRYERERPDRQAVSAACYLAVLCTSTTCKQAHFNGVSFTQPWPPLHRSVYNHCEAVNPLLLRMPRFLLSRRSFLSNCQSAFLTLGVQEFQPRLCFIDSYLQMYEKCLVQWV